MDSFQTEHFIGLLGVVTSIATYLLGRHQNKILSKNSAEQHMQQLRQIERHAQIAKTQKYLDFANGNDIIIKKLLLELSHIGALATSKINFALIPLANESKFPEYDGPGGVFHLCCRALFIEESDGLIRALNPYGAAYTLDSYAANGGNEFSHRFYRMITELDIPSEVIENASQRVIAAMKIADESFKDSFQKASPHLSEIERHLKEASQELVPIDRNVLTRLSSQLGLLRWIEKIRTLYIGYPFNDDWRIGTIYRLIEIALLPRYLSNEYMDVCRDTHSVDWDAYWKKFKSVNLKEQNYFWRSPS